MQVKRMLCVQTTKHASIIINKFYFAIFVPINLKHAVKMSNKEEMNYVMKALRFTAFTANGCKIKLQSLIATLNVKKLSSQ